MTTIVRLTHAELRKLMASRTYLIALAISVGLAIISVAVDAAVAGKTGQPALGTVADTNKMLKLGSVCCVATLVLGIIGSGGEYRHKTIIPAMLAAPRRGILVAAPGAGEHGRDDRLVPVLAAGADDAQHQHGHGADRAELEHLLGVGHCSEGGLAALACHRRVHGDADDREADGHGEADEVGTGRHELAEFGAGETGDGSHDE